MSLSYGQIEAALPRFYRSASATSGPSWRSRACRSCLPRETTAWPTGTTSGTPETVCRQGLRLHLGQRHQVLAQLPRQLPLHHGPWAPPQLNGSVAGGEVAVYWSGGGFSDIFPMPEWQSSAVGGYLDKHAPHFPPDVVWNNSGNARAYPDVSALGVNLTTVLPRHGLRRGRHVGVDAPLRLDHHAAQRGEDAGRQGPPLASSTRRCTPTRHVQTTSSAAATRAATAMDSRAPRLGSSDWAGHAQLSQDAQGVPGPSVEKERGPGAG